MELKKLNEIFVEIDGTSGTNAKQELLKKYGSDETFKKVLRLCFSPHITTNIDVKKINKNLNTTFSNYTKINSIVQFLDFLEIECTGKLKDIYAIQVYINKQDVAYQQLLKNIATKKLTIGVNASGINKAFPGMIPVFKPMLAHKLADYENYLVDKVVYVTLKLDGNRALLFKENGKVSAFTRSGKPISELTEIEKAASMLKDGYVYDGELIINKPKDGKKRSSTELLNMTNKIVRSNGEKTGLTYHMFDMVPIEEFNIGKSKEVYEKRRAMLDKIKSTKFIKILPVLYKGEMNDDVYKLFKEYVSNGEEGVMVNTADGLYVNKRTKDILKIKQFYTMDLKIVDIIEGTGKAKGRAEKIVVEYKGNKVEPGMGKGVNNAIKKDLLENKDKYIGKIAMVSYKEVTKDSKTGKESLNLPKFLLIRDDKKEVSYA